MAGFRPPPPGSIPGLGSPDMADAMQDMQSGQPASAGASSHSSMSSISSMMQGQHGKTAQNARSVGSPVQEAKYLAKDIGKGILEFLPGPIKNLVSPTPNDSPEAAMKKRQMLQRYNQMNAEQQAYVNKKLQEEQMEKRKKEEEEKQRTQMLAQQSNDLPVPEGKKTGEAAMGAGKSNKSQTLSKLQNDRKKLSSAG